MSIIEGVEKNHDFEREIKQKKEAQKLKIIREINDRLSYLNENESLHSLDYGNMVSFSGSNSLSLVR